MSALMDSPDYNPVLPNPDSQGSPFFHFLSNLSPIKPIISGNAAQTLSELSFPPPPGVFVSPKIKRQSDGIRSKRNILPGLSDNVEKTQERSSLTSTRQNQASWSHVVNHNQNKVSAPASISNGDEIMTKRTEDFRSYSAEAEIRSSHHSQETADILIGQQEFSKASCETQSPKRELNQFTSPNLSILNLQNKLNLMKREFTESCSHSNDGHLRESDARNKNFREDYVPSSNLDPSLSNENNAIIPADSKYTSQNVTESWYDASTEQLSKILRSMHGMNEENSRTINCDDASHGALSFHKNEEQQDESKQVCRAAMAGIRRRCLDFEALGNENDLTIFGMSSDKPSNCLFPNPSENIISQSVDLKSETCTPSDISNSSLLSQYAIENSTFTSKIDPLYLPLQSKLQIVFHNSDSTVPHGLSSGSHQPGLSLTAPLTHAIDKIHMSSAALKQPGKFMPMDSFIESSAGRDIILSPRNCLNPVSSPNHLGLERVLSLVETIRMNQQETNSASVETGKPAFHHPMMLDIESIQSLLNPTRMEIGFPSGEIYKQLESEHADDSGRCPRSPKKRRKLSIQAAENPEEGCKNCKCKKSKCLKLYCECFAAGVYCIDSCNCTECYNKPEFEEMVLGTRQQIESRNPLAFVPKIIRTVEAFPTIGEEYNDTPASARHKRGCNCKKSQCLKKYCECYQAGVGCADGCRCEGCKNIFGRNDGPADGDEKMQQATPLRTKGEAGDAKIPVDSRPTPDHQPDQSRSLSPITPYIEHPMQCRSNVEFQSTEKNASPFILPLPMISFNSPYNPFDSLEGNRKSSEMLMNSHDFASPPNRLTDTDRLSQCWNGFTDMYSLYKPLPQLSPVTADALLNKINVCQSHWQDRDNSIPNSGSQLPGLTSQEPTPATHMPLVFPSDSYQFENSFTVPVTPTLASSNLPQRNYDFEEISDTASLQSAWFSDEENSPNIFKESNNLCAPDIVLKTRSPQQKRVFSNFKGSNLRPVLSPVTGFKNGRKFILQSLGSSGCPGNIRT